MVHDFLNILNFPCWLCQYSYGHPKQGAITSHEWQLNQELFANLVEQFSVHIKDVFTNAENIKQSNSSRVDVGPSSMVIPSWLTRPQASDGEPMAHMPHLACKALSSGTRVSGPLTYPCGNKPFVWLQLGFPFLFLFWVL